jgi:hypothetical protein
MSTAVALPAAHSPRRHTASGLARQGSSRPAAVDLVRLHRGESPDLGLYQELMTDLPSTSTNIGAKCALNDIVITTDGPNPVGLHIADDLDALFEQTDLDTFNSLMRWLNSVEDCGQSSPMHTDSQLPESRVAALLTDGSLHVPPCAGSQPEPVLLATDTLDELHGSISHAVSWQDCSLSMGASGGLEEILPPADKSTK